MNIDVSWLKTSALLCIKHSVLECVGLKENKILRKQEITFIFTIRKKDLFARYIIRKLYYLS